MENIKLSYIVPVYNVAAYLRKCVESLINQDFTDYEIILVDDGSPDECPQICDEYAAAHDNIRVIHQANAGLSAARNAGLKVAKGEFVCFVDSDDYWHSNVLSRLMSIIERDNLDVLRFNYQNVNEYGEIIHPNKDPKRDVDYSAVVTDGERFLNERLGPACYAVMFIIKHCMIVNSGELIVNSKDCLFKEGIYFEDVDWTPRMVLRAKRVASTPMVVYNYLWREGSITLPTDPKKRIKVMEDKIKLLYGFREQCKLVKDPKWYVWMISYSTISVLGILSMMSYAERKPYLHELKSLELFPLATANEKLRSNRIKIHIANISPNLYCLLMSLRK